VFSSCWVLHGRGYEPLPLIDFSLLGAFFWSHFERCLGPRSLCILVSVSRCNPELTSNSSSCKTGSSDLFPD
jgi:hypothetical protein